MGRGAAPDRHGAGPSGGRIYSYLSGFDPTLLRFSLGNLILGLAIEEAIQAGAQELDLLRGSEPYKYLWGARDRMNYRLLVWHSPLPGDIAAQFGS